MYLKIIPCAEVWDSNTSFLPLAVLNQRVWLLDFEEWKTPPPLFFLIAREQYTGRPDILGNGEEENNLVFTGSSLAICELRGTTGHGPGAVVRGISGIHKKAELKAETGVQS